MIVAPCGGGFRLGNRLELFLHLAAFSQRTGIPVAVPSFARFANDFSGTRGDPFCRYPQRSFRPWLPACAAHGAAWLPTRVPGLASVIGGTCVDCPNDKEFNLGSPEFLHLARAKRFVFLRSGWQYRDWDALPGFLPLARAFFRPSPRIEAVAAETAKRCRRDAEVLIGVHIRRTDFREHLGGRYFFGLDFYAERMREIVESTAGRRVAFLICSDEPRSRAEFPGLDVSFAGLAATGDLAALSCCDYVMGPAISSFSGWAALIGGKPFLGLRPETSGVSLAVFGPSPLLGA